jgi:tetratricopeptide (TPR) repeat protein
MKSPYNYFTLTASVLILLLGTSSCRKDFLTVVPKGSLIAQNTNDYSNILNSQNLYAFITATDQVIMSPEVCAIEPYYTAASLAEKRAFGWEADLYEPNDDMNEITSFMSKIYMYNKIINEVESSTGGTDAQKASLQAEALANRAWCYFQLINYFGKPYNASTAATDPGYPIVTVADVTATNFTRASVKDVYAFILQDLNKAIPALPVNLTNTLRMSRGAAEAFLGKVEMFMGNYTDALTQLNAAFTDFGSAQIPLGLYNYNVTTLPGGVNAPFTIGPRQPALGSNSEEAFSKELVERYSYIFNTILIGPETSSLYGPSDIRITTFYSQSAFFAAPFGIPGVYRKVGLLYDPIGVFLPEVYLLRAECKARANDLTGAIADVETLRKNRMPANVVAVPAGLSQTDLIKFIIDENTREFAVLGYNWFTIRRLSQDPIFANKVYTHKVYNADGTLEHTFTLAPERMVLRFNQKIMLQNPGWTNNP